MMERIAAQSSRIWLIGMFLLADTAVQIAFKLAGERAGNSDFDLDWVATAAGSPIFWIAIGLYFTVFVLWMMILQQTDLSRAFPLTALTYVTVPAAGLLLFHETVSLERTLGIALVLAGVVMVGHED
jgi:drug/metabolite transporter (DMT)-like permease